jgi:DNA primase
MRNLLIIPICCIELRKSGAELKCKCPFHDDRTASAAWNEELNTFILTATDAQRAVEISVDQQLDDLVKKIESSLEELGTSMNEIQDDIEND